MPLSEWGALVAIIVSLGTVIWAVIRERHKPQLDAEQTKAVKQEVAKTTNELNIARDRRILALEVWGDSMRPWARAVHNRHDKMCVLIEDAYSTLKLPVPHIDPLPEMPKFPEPEAP